MCDVRKPLEDQICNSNKMTFKLIAHYGMVIDGTCLRVDIRSELQGRVMHERETAPIYIDVFGSPNWLAS